jgi:hypothetical protein
VNRPEEALLESCVDASRDSIVYGSCEVDPIRWARTTIGAVDERGSPRNGRVARERSGSREVEKFRKKIVKSEKTETRMMKVKQG